MLAVENFPVISGIEALSIFVDHDVAAGPTCGTRVFGPVDGSGREVFRVIPDRCGDDMNEVVQRRHP
jgi:hypothetical protein